MAADSSAAAVDHAAPTPTREAVVVPEVEHGALAEGQFTGTPAPPPDQAAALLQDARLDGRANGPVRESAFRQVQRTYGNRATGRLWRQAAGERPPAPVTPAVQRLLQRVRDASVQRVAGEDDDLPAAQDLAAAPAAIQPAKTDEAQDPNAAAGGATGQPVQIPDGKPPEESQLPARGPCDCLACKQDDPPGGAPAGGAAPAPAAPAPAGPKSVEAGAITINWTAPNTKAVDPFGAEDYKATHKNATATEAGGKVKLDFTIDVECAWGVNGGTDKDVPSATDAVVTAENHASGKKVYEQIALDLTPSAADNWRPPRTYFWSKSLTQRHEQYHTTDDQGWANGAGKQVVIDFLKTKTVSAATATAEIATLLGNAMTAMNNANFQWYSGGGKPYIQRPGEMRAFADGKDAYTTLVADVRAQGAKLEAAKAAAPAGGGGASGGGGGSGGSGGGSVGGAIVGGVIGGIVGGPIGGVLGAALGGALDRGAGSGDR